MDEIRLLRNYAGERKYTSSDVYFNSYGQRVFCVSKNWRESNENKIVGHFSRNWWWFNDDLFRELCHFYATWRRNGFDIYSPLEYYDFSCYILETYCEAI